MLYIALRHNTRDSKWMITESITPIISSPRPLLGLHRRYESPHESPAYFSIYALYTYLPKHSALSGSLLGYQYLATAFPSPINRPRLKRNYHMHISAQLLGMGLGSGNFISPRRSRWLDRVLKKTDLASGCITVGDAGIVSQVKQQQYLSCCQRLYSFLTVMKWWLELPETTFQQVIVQPECSICQNAQISIVGYRYVDMINWR